MVIFLRLLILFQKEMAEWDSQQIFQLLLCCAQPVTAVYNSLSYKTVVSNTVFFPRDSTLKMEILFGWCFLTLYFGTFSCLNIFPLTYFSLDISARFKSVKWGFLFFWDWFRVEQGWLGRSSRCWSVIALLS